MEQFKQVTVFRGDRAATAVNVWKSVKEEMRDVCKPDFYRSYVESLELLAEEEGRLIIFAPNGRHQAEWVRDNAQGSMQRKFDRALPQPKPLAVLPRQELSAALQEMLDERLDGGGFDDQGEGAEVDAGLSGVGRFETFREGESNRRAVMMSRMVASNTGGALRLVLLCGAPGVGKTHLCESIATESVQRDATRRVVMISGQRFVEEFVDALKKNGGSQAFKAHMREARLLIIDDVQRIAGKKATEEECFDTIAAVLERGGQVVLTALTGASGLNGFGERLAHHLKCATEVEIGMPDAMLRREILDARVACYAEEEPGFEVETRALDIIAERMAVSGRELDGAVRQLFLEWMDKRQPVSWEMAEIALRSKIGAGERRITLDMIKQATCKHFDMSVAELLRKTRETSVAYPRQVAMYLCAKQTTLSLPNIARMFGGFDHTTVLHARRKVEDLLKLQEADARGEAPSDRKLVRLLPLAHQCRKDVEAIHRLLRQPN